MAVLRRWWMLAICMVLGGAAAVLYLANTTPTYTSTSRLYVKPKPPRVFPELDDSSMALRTQAEFIRSTPVLVAALDDPAFYGSELLDDVTLTDIPSCRSRRRPVVELRENLSVEVSEETRILSVSANSPYPREAALLANAVVAAYIDFHGRQKRDTASELVRILRTEKVKRDAVRDAKLQEMLDFKKEHSDLSLSDGKDNIILQRLASLSGAMTTAELETIRAGVAYETTAATLANAGDGPQATAFRQLASDLETILKAELQLRAALARMEFENGNAARTAEGGPAWTPAAGMPAPASRPASPQLEKAGADLAALEATKKLLLAQLEAVRDAAEAALFRQQQKEGQQPNEEARLRGEIAAIQSQIRQQQEAYGYGPEHRSVKALQSTLSEKELELATLAARRPTSGPSDMPADITGMMAEVATALRRYIEAVAHENRLRESFETQFSKALILNADESTYARLQSEHDQAKQLCDMLDDRIRQIDVLPGAEALDITVMEPAGIPSAPSEPVQTHILTVGLLGGLFLGLVVTSVWHWTDRRLRSSEAISVAFGRPVLGVVPEVKGRLEPSSVGLRMQLEPTSALADAFRTIRTTLRAGVGATPTRTVLLTSACRGEGRTTVLTNLGIAMARAGERVLLVDADLHNPGLHDIFGMAAQPGLSNILTGMANLDAVVQHVAISGLDVVPSGPAPPVPAETLDSRSLAGLLQEASAKYEWVLVDAPPVLGSTDACILAHRCDATVLVVPAGRSTRQQLDRVREALISVEARVLGVIVNRAAVGSKRYHPHSGYGAYGFAYVGAADPETVSADKGQSDGPEPAETPPGTGT